MHTCLAERTGSYTGLRLKSLPTDYASGNPTWKYVYDSHADRQTCIILQSKLFLMDIQTVSTIDLHYIFDYLCIHFVDAWIVEGNNQRSTGRLGANVVGSNQLVKIKIGKFPVAGELFQNKLYLFFMRFKLWSEY